MGTTTTTATATATATVNHASHPCMAGTAASALFPHTSPTHPRQMTTTTGTTTAMATTTTTGSTTTGSTGTRMRRWTTRCAARAVHHLPVSDVVCISRSTQHQPPTQGSFAKREKPLKRDYLERAFTVGIGGPVGSGKTALMYALCRALRHDYSIAAVNTIDGHRLARAPSPAHLTFPLSFPHPRFARSPTTSSRRRTASSCCGTRRWNRSASRRSRRAGARTRPSARTSRPTWRPASR